tara:strand:+ start:783 stop:1322 length:540 start_codon:yes stop_codon:yes gene_type:complete
MRLTTKRLVLREPTLKDAEVIVKNINNLQITKYLSKVPYPYTKKDAVWWLNHLKKKKKTKEGYSFLIFLNKIFLGNVSIMSINSFSKTGELGYWLVPTHHRKGYMTEAATKVLDFAFNTLKLQRVGVSAFTINKASNGLIKKLGFTFEGTEKKGQRCKATGKFHDVHYYGMLRKDWKKK